MKLITAVEVKYLTLKKYILGGELYKNLTFFGGGDFSLPAVAYSKSHHNAQSNALTYKKIHFH